MAQNNDLLVAYADTDAGRRAAEFTAERAAKTGESVHVIHIGDDLTEEEMRASLEDAFTSRSVPVTFQMFEIGGSDEQNISVRAKLGEIVDEHDYTMVVMGNEKRGLFHELSEGSVSKALIEDQSVPILLVP